MSRSSRPSAILCYDTALHLSVHSPNIQDVAAFLAQHLGAIDESSLERVGHGEWSKAYVFRTADGRDLVARFSQFDDDFLKDQRARGFIQGRIPIPEILEIRTAFDGFLAVSSRAYGTFLEDRDANALQRLLPALLATLDAVRQADISNTTGFGLWRGSDGTAPFTTWHEALLRIATQPPSARLSGWREALAQNAEAQRVFEAAFIHMQRLVPACPNERHLIHSDLLNFNVLVQGDRISALLDWGSSMYGDFLWDLAWLTFWQPWYTAWSTLDIRQAARDHYAATGLDVPNFDARLRCYEIAIGLDGLAYQTWANRPSTEWAWTARRLESLIPA